MEMENNTSYSKNKPGLTLKVGSLICNTIDKSMNPPMHEEAPEGFKKFVGGVTIFGTLALGAAVIDYIN